MYFPSRQTTCQAFFLICTFFLQFSLKAQPYQSAWEAISANDTKAARDYLEKAKKDPTTAADANLTNMLLAIFDGHDMQGQQDFEDALKTMVDPYPYCYALWPNDCVGGSPSLKSDRQAKFLEQLAVGPKSPAMLSASARYLLSFHYAALHDFPKAKLVKQAIGNVTAWQFTGVFDNVSDSGFDKKFPPLTQAFPESRFKAANNADIQWFSPVQNGDDGWVLLGNHIKGKSGIAYAQSFVAVPRDMDLVLGTGFTGSCYKIWVNDRLVFAEMEQRRTDFDVFRVPCQLKKGNNRILVQLGLCEDLFANFCVRLMDKKGQLVPDVVSSTKFADYPKAKGPLPDRLPFFAETYFQQKITAEADNLLNYYLLGEAYLRALKCQDALNVVEKALERAPDNIFFRSQRLRCYEMLHNLTSLTRELEDIKKCCPEHFIALTFRFQEDMSNEKFEAAEDVLDLWEARYGKNAVTYTNRINLLLQRKKMQEAIQLIAEAHLLYPDEPIFVNWQHDVEMKINKKPNAAIDVYSNFLTQHYNFQHAVLLAKDYIDLGMGDKAVGLYEEFDHLYPAATDPAEYLFNYYYNIKDIPKAKIWIEKLLRLAPFEGLYWENAAKLSERAGDKAESLLHFKQALQFNPNNYAVRRQIRELEGKTDVANLFPQNDPVDLYKKTNTAGKEGEFDWYYLLDEQCVVLHPEGNSEVYATTLVKILNEAGIDSWKEHSVRFDQNSQRLFVEKAEVLKLDGSRVRAEQNGGELVFPNLQVGDGIYLRYHLLNYAYGRMDREFYNSFIFNAYVPTDAARFCLMAPAGLLIDFKNYRHTLSPTIKDFKEEGMRQYLWETFDEAAIKDESLMPPLCDVAKVLHVSTVPNWNTISSWYGDISSLQAQPDYEVRRLAQTLFANDTTHSQTAKARRIYQWILKNIRYSSVPFRQSGYVPQRASKVIQTKLGDCKDLATLFAALARESGMKANLVLVNTRDHGLHDMELPSIGFNHCLVKVVTDNQIWYLEMTDPDMPFGSLPNDVIQSFALEIPFGEKDAVSSAPFVLDPKNRLKEARWETTKINVTGRDLTNETAFVQSGAIAAYTRGKFKDLAPAKRLESMQAGVSKKFDNPTTVHNLCFGDLSKIQDTLQFQVSYTVKNEVVALGELNAFKIPFYNVYFGVDAFPENTRQHPLYYWNYENTDQYTEKITVQLPDDKTIAELPKDVTLSFKGMLYALKLERLASNKFTVVREITTQRNEISPADYPLFRAFSEAVTNAEGQWITFK